MPVTPVPVPPAQHPPQEEAATAKAADEPAPPPSLGYAVQLETLPERADAEAAAAAWARKGYDTYVYPVRSPQGRIRYTVRTGIWATQDEAAREAKAVRVRKKIYAVPVPVGLDGAGQPTPSVP
jgi:cell division septation protein DedD